MCACEHGHLNIAKRLLLEPHCDASLEDHVSGLCLKYDSYSWFLQQGCILIFFRSFSPLCVPFLARALRLWMSSSICLAESYYSCFVNIKKMPVHRSGIPTPSPSFNFSSSTHVSAPVVICIPGYTEVPEELSVLPITAWKSKVR